MAVGANLLGCIVNAVPRGQGGYSYYSGYGYYQYGRYAQASNGNGANGHAKNGNGHAVVPANGHKTITAVGVAASDADDREV